MRVHQIQLGSISRRALLQLSRLSTNAPLSHKQGRDRVLNWSCTKSINLNREEGIEYQAGTLQHSIY